MDSSSGIPENRDLVEIPVWDLPVRLFHWVLVLAIATSWISGKAGRLDIHYVSGLVVLGLVTFRLLWGLFGSPNARFTHFVKGPRAVILYLRHALGVRAPSYSFGHNPAGALMVVALIGLVALQAFTGLGNTDDVLFDGPLRDDLPEWLTSLMGWAHGWNALLILILVGLHVAVIIAYRLFKRENLVRAMITGKAALPRETAESAAARGESRFASFARALYCAIAATLVPAAIHWLN